jgi:uncharacterized lipoprotein YajG
MYREMLRLVAGAAIAGSLFACHNFQEEQVAVEKVPPSARPAALADAGKVILSVVAVDRRAQRTDRLNVKEGWGHPQVLATNDVVEVVRGAVEDDFKALGFVVTEGGLIVTVELQNFYDDNLSVFYAGNGSGTNGIAGHVAFTLRVKDRTGLTRYMHFYEAMTRPTIRFDQTADKTKAALEEALGEILKKVNEDKALQAALLTAPRGN